MTLLYLTDKIGDMTKFEIILSLCAFALVVFLFAIRFLSVATKNRDRHLYPTTRQVKKANASQLASWIINLPIVENEKEARILRHIVRRHFDLQENNRNTFSDEKAEQELQDGQIDECIIVSDY